MIASLPMYWRPETAAAWARFWTEVRGNDPTLPDLTLPEALPGDWFAHWLDPALALSMTCGLPFRTRLRERVTYVGTLDFGLGGPQGHYHSVLITRAGCTFDRPGLRLAYNAPDSQSGWAAAAEGPKLTAPRLIETGAHVMSFRAVAEGRADLAYIDAVTWRLIRRHEPLANRVIIAARTAPTPGLPLITALGRDPAPLRAALTGAISNTPPEVLAAMGGVTGLAVLDEASYFAQPIPAPPGAS